jgi:HAD superfamily hydrolase (TIGR01509 family)
MRLAGCFPRAIDAVVFDMDGVLADTEPIHQLAMAAMMEPYGVALTDDEYAWTVGRDNDETWTWVRERWGIPDSARVLTDAFEEALLPRLATLHPAPGAAALVADLVAVGVPLALASSSSRRVVDVTLRALGFDATFAATVAGNEVLTSKPDPGIYLAAAARLGVDARRCIAIEDSAPGTEAARAAGMKVVGIRSRYVDGDLPADIVIHSLEDLV